MARVLCALFGLPMATAELETFTKHTGRTRGPDKPVTEAWLICGRRAGKSFMLAVTAVYLAAFKDWAPYLTRGERGNVVIIAADRKQARVIMGYIRSLLNDNLMLRELVIRELAEEIDLSNKISIEVATCSYRTIRGRTIVAALADEIAFWQSEGSANPDEEVLSRDPAGNGNRSRQSCCCAPARLMPAEAHYGTRIRNGTA